MDIFKHANMMSTVTGLKRRYDELIDAISWGQTKPLQDEIAVIVSTLDKMKEVYGNAYISDFINGATRNAGEHADAMTHNLVLAVEDDVDMLYASSIRDAYCEKWQLDPINFLVDRLSDDSLVINEADAVL